MPRLRVHGLEDRTAPAAGDLDPSFGTAGRASFNVSTTAAHDDTVTGVAVRSDGHIAVAGYAVNDFGTGPDDDFLAAQLKPDGTLDSSFNFGGTRFVNFGGATNTADRAFAVAYLPDGRMLLAGYTTTALNGKDFALARLTPDGSLDPSFGTGGLVSFGFDLAGSKDDVAYGLAVMSDGRIVVAGSADNGPAGLDLAVARLTAAGKLDTTFSGDGRMTASFSGSDAKDDVATGVAVRADGRIVAGGYTTVDATGNTDFAVAQFTATGFLDPSFNGTGLRTVAFDLGGDKADKANAVALLPNGDVVLAGSVQTGTNGLDMAAVEVTPGGNSLDTAFDADGKATVGFDLGGTNDDVATAVGVQAGGQIVLAGWATVGATGNTDYAVAQLTDAGQPDTAFSDDGRTTVAFDLGGTGTDQATAAAVQPNGRIVLAGDVTAASPTNGTDVGVARVIGRPPFAPAILGVTADTGVSDTDGVTTDTTPLLRGTAEPGIEVRISQTGVGLVGSVVADASGNWTFGATVSPGSYQFTAVARDPAGTDSAPSAAFPVTVDVTGPSATVTRGPGMDAPVVGGPAVFVVTFSEPTFGFGPEDVTLAGTAGATTAAVTNPSGDNKTYLVTVTGAVRSGTIELLVPANGATDAAGNPNLAAVPTDDVVTFRFPPTLVGAQQFAVGADAGGGAARLYNADRTERFTVPPFGPDYTGGVRVAAADFNGDGIADLVTATGPGSATLVRVFDGATQQELFSVSPFEASFTGGVYVAAGDLTGDGIADLVISPDQGGGPRVRIFSGGNGFAQIADFFAIDDVNFRGGARAAVGDINGDGVGDLVVAAGFGGGPRVAAFNGLSLSASPVKLFGDFLAFEPELRNGTYVAVGDLNGDGKADLVVGGGPGGGPRVSVFDGAALLTNRQVRTTDFFADDVNSRGGVRVAAKDLDGDGKADLLTGAGTGAGSGVSGYTGAGLTGGSPAVAFALDAYPGFTGGVFVG